MNKISLSSDCKKDLRYALCAMLFALCLAVPFSAYAEDMLIVKDAGGLNTKFVVTDGGLVGIGTGAPGQALDVVAPNNGLIQFSNTTADNTTKTARLVVRHYLNSQIPLYVFGAASVASNNYLAFGGGSPSANAATQIDFFTASNTTTPNGFSRITISKDGNIGIGSTSPTQKLDVNSNGIRIEQPKTPASSAAACNQGDMSWDANYVYVCVATNTWKRAGLASW